MKDYLPKKYTDFIQGYPEIAKHYQDLGKACHEAGPLDEKTRQLIKLGIATGQQSEGAIKSHARQALDAGCSEKEVRHAVILALTTCGFPKVIATLDWVSEVLSAREQS